VAFVSASVKGLMLDHHAENLSCFGLMMMIRLHELPDIVIVKEKVSYQYLQERTQRRLKVILSENVIIDQTLVY
jgi:hypothetical protein